MKLIFKYLDINRQAVGTISKAMTLLGFGPELIWVIIVMMIMMTDSQIQRCNCSCLGNWEETSWILLPTQNINFYYHPHFVLWIFLWPTCRYGLYLSGSSNALRQGLESLIPPCLTLCAIVYTHAAKTEHDHNLSHIYGRGKCSLNGDTGLQEMRTTEMEEIYQ